MEKSNEPSVNDGQPSEVRPEDALGQARVRITELEDIVAARDAEIAGLQKSHGGLETKLKELSGSLAEAVSSYREMVVKANPDVPPELIAGETLAAVADSLRQARTLVARVREGLEAELSRTKFPAGSPERGAASLDLSPREKIQQAIRKKG